MSKLQQPCVYLSLIAILLTWMVTLGKADTPVPSDHFDKIRRLLIYHDEIDANSAVKFLRDSGCEVLVWEIEGGGHESTVKVGKNWTGKSEDLLLLRQIPFLTGVDYSYHKGADGAMQIISNVPSVNAVFVDSESFSGLGIRELEKLPNLRVLSIKCNKLENSELRFLAVHWKLQQLLFNLENVPQLASIQELKNRMPGTEVIVFEQNLKRD